MPVLKTSSTGWPMNHHGRFQGGFLNLPNDNMAKTIAVATLLCLVCSIVVSTSATLLKPTQVANKLLDKKKNILMVAGISDASGGQSVEELFQRIEPKIVDMASGQYSDEVDAATFDQRRAANDPQYRVELDRERDIAQIGGLSRFGNVYLVRDGDQVSRYILPIRGYGLWGTLYGFIALESDASTVSGITFYEHKETPGLGGEIENPRWQKVWVGKQLLDDRGQLALQVIKGEVNENTPQAANKIDGLAGATLTSNGVSNMISFWMGDNGYGPYLERIRGAGPQAAAHSSNPSGRG